MRLLNQSLIKLNKGEAVDETQLKYSQYSCFINYLKETLDNHKSKQTDQRNNGDKDTRFATLSISQV